MSAEIIRFNGESWVTEKAAPRYEQSFGRVMRDGFPEPGQNEMLAKIKKLRSNHSVTEKPFITRSSSGTWVCRKDRGQTNVFCVWGKNPTQIYLAWLRYFVHAK